MTYLKRRELIASTGFNSIHIVTEGTNTRVISSKVREINLITAIEEAEQAAKDGQDIFKIKVELEKVGFVTRYKESQIRKSWRGNLRHGWNDYYYYNGFVPGLYEVRCPKCNGQAVVDKAFKYYEKREDISKNTNKLTIHERGSSFIVDQYPSLVSYSPKYEQQYWLIEVIKCLNCPFLAIYESNWPNDAYYQWNIRGKFLWAKNRNHALTLLSFLESSKRDTHLYPAYVASLEKLPKEITLAKVRNYVVKQMKKRLNF